METPLTPDRVSDDFAVEVLAHRLGAAAPEPVMVRVGRIASSKLVGLELPTGSRPWRLTSPDARCLGLALVQLAEMTFDPDYLAELPGPRLLPVVTQDGRKFYVDERLGEMRAVDDPADRIRFRSGVFD
jgi:hypothetical protein